MYMIKIKYMYTVYYTVYTVYIHVPPRNSMLLRSARRAARLRLPNMAHEARNAVGIMLCVCVCVCVCVDA